MKILGELVRLAYRCSHTAISLVRPVSIAYLGRYDCTLSRPRVKGKSAMFLLFRPVQKGVVS